MKKLFIRQNLITLFYDFPFNFAEFKQEIEYINLDDDIDIFYEIEDNNLIFFHYREETNEECQKRYDEVEKANRKRLDDERSERLEYERLKRKFEK